MGGPTLEEHLRRATRNFTAPLAEDEVMALGADLARELARAHGDTPARHPSLDPAAIPLLDGRPRLDTAGTGSVPEDLFQLGALLAWLATGVRPAVAWRLDGVPVAGVSTVSRRAALSGLAGPVRAERFATAAEAAQALESARAPRPEGATAWPSFRGDASRSGARPLASPAGIDSLWHVRLGPMVASPVIAHGAVLVATADGRLCFVEPATGRRLHELRVGSAIESTPALAGDIAFLGTDDGELIAVDTAAGTERYRARLGSMLRSSPLALDGHVVVGAVIGKTDGALLALDPDKGKVRWTRKLGAVFSSPALAGERVLVGSDDGALYAVDLGRGTVAWSAKLGAKVRGTPVVSGDLAYVGDFAGMLAAVRLSDGGRVWTQEIGHPLYSSPTVAAGLCVVGCREGHVHAFDAATGAPRFEIATRGPIVGSAVAAGDRFLIGSTDGALYLFGPDGAVLQRVDLARSGVQSSPALAAEGTVYVGSGDGLHALRLRA